MSRSDHPSRTEVYNGNEIGRLTGWSKGGSGRISFTGRALGTDYPLPNAYVFCTSSSAEPSLEQAAALGYDSFYIIKNPSLFSDRMAQQIAREVGGSSNDIAFHGQVSYLPKKEAVFPQLPEFVRSHASVEPYLYLLKAHTSVENENKIYANEHENRFVFVPIDGHGKTIPLNKERIYLEPGAVRDLLEQGQEAV